MPPQSRGADAPLPPGKRHVVNPVSTTNPSVNMHYAAPRPAQPAPSLSNYTEASYNSTTGTYNASTATPASPTSSSSPAPGANSSGHGAARPLHVSAARAALLPRILASQEQYRNQIGYRVHKEVAFQDKDTVFSQSPPRRLSKESHRERHIPTPANSHAHTGHVSSGQHRQQSSIGTSSTGSRLDTTSPQEERLREKEPERFDHAQRVFIPSVRPSALKQGPSLHKQTQERRLEQPKPRSEPLPRSQHASQRPLETPEPINDPFDVASTISTFSIPDSLSASESGSETEDDDESLISPLPSTTSSSQPFNNRRSSLYSFPASRSASSLHSSSSYPYHHPNATLFAPPFYNRPPTPLPPSPSLTSLLRAPLPTFSSASYGSFSALPSRPTTPGDYSSDTEAAGVATPTGSSTTAATTATNTLTRSARTAQRVPRASPKVPTYEYYGFVLYLGSSVAFGMYILWSYLPTPFLHRLGIYYYPDRWWSLAVPAWLVAALCYIYVALAAWNTGYETVKVGGLEGFIDEKGQIAVIDEAGKIVRNPTRAGISGRNKPVKRNNGKDDEQVTVTDPIYGRSGIGKLVYKNKPAAAKLSSEIPEALQTGSEPLNNLIFSDGKSTAKTDATHSINVRKRNNNPASNVTAGSSDSFNSSSLSSATSIRNARSVTSVSSRPYLSSRATTPGSDIRSISSLSHTSASPVARRTSRPDSLMLTSATARSLDTRAPIPEEKAAANGTAIARDRLPTTISFPTMPQISTSARPQAQRKAQQQSSYPTASDKPLSNAQTTSASRIHDRKSNGHAYPSPPTSSTSSRTTSRHASRAASPHPQNSHSDDIAREQAEEDGEDLEEEPLPELDWKRIWSDGTDAVLDVPIGGVCEILYGAGRIRSASFDSGYDDDYNSDSDNRSDAGSEDDLGVERAYSDGEVGEMHEWRYGGDGKEEVVYGKVSLHLGERCPQLGRDSRDKL